MAEIIGVGVGIGIECILNDDPDTDPDPDFGCRGKQGILSATVKGGNTIRFLA